MRKKVTMKVKKRIVELGKEGLSTGIICERMGLSDSTVRRVLNQYKIVRKK